MTPTPAPTTGGRASFSVTVHLPVITRAASMARETVRSALLRSGLDALLDDALVVTSELVTNAFLRGGNDIFLELHVVDDGLELAVSSPPPVVPEQRHASHDDSRSATLVASLTSAHGLQAQPDGGKRAWARFVVPPA